MCLARVNNPAERVEARTMNNELMAVLSYMEKERGIDREVLILALEEALLAASRKSVGPARDLRIEIDRETCDIKAITTVEVVEKVQVVHDEITLAKAQKIQKSAKIGDMVSIEVTPKNFGRIAAQTAKQTIMQKIRQVEKDMVYDEYKDRPGDIVTGSVRRFNRSDIVVDLGRAEAVIPARERVPTEEYQIGDRIRAFVVSVTNTPGGTEIILSRGHPDFVKRLFELEVAEIADGTVEIKGIARESGYRTKVAVLSHDEKVDSVGACVGMRGIRVKNIVRELSGEKIDIVRWSDDTRTYVTNALSPARLLKVTIDEDSPGLIRVVADADQLSLAIGKRGQNVRLSAKLIGCKIDIEKDETTANFDARIAEAVQSLAAIEGITTEQAGKLVQSGFPTVEGIIEAEQTDLETISGFDSETVAGICAAVVAHQAKTAEDGETTEAATAEDVTAEDVTEPDDAENTPDVQEDEKNKEDEQAPEDHESP